MQIRVLGLTAWLFAQIHSSINGMQICTAPKLEDLDGRWQIGEMQMSVLAQGLVNNSAGCGKDKQLRRQLD